MKLSEVQDYILSPININFKGNDILITPYISDTMKSFAVNKIVDTIYNDENTDFSEEQSFSNKDLKHTIFVNILLGYYTDIDISDMGYTEVCDIATLTGLLDEILKHIPQSEINTFTEFLNFAIEEKKFGILITKLNEIKEDSIENQLKKFLVYIEENMTEKKLVSLIDKGIKKFNKLDMDKFGALNGVLKEFGEKGMTSPDSTINALNSMKNFVTKEGK